VLHGFCSDFRQLSKYRAVELRRALSVQFLKLGHQIALGEGDSIRMLRIERSTNGQVVFTLSGRMQTEDIENFRQLVAVETPGQQLMFDLRDVTLVNQDAVTFLAECEASGIKLENCPLHIRNWIDQEKRRRRILKFPMEP
jgi:hypothetical protein